MGFKFRTFSESYITYVMGEHSIGDWADLRKRPHGHCYLEEELCSYPGGSDLMHEEWEWHPPGVRSEWSEGLPVLS